MVPYSGNELPGTALIKALSEHDNARIREAGSKLPSLQIASTIQDLSLKAVLSTYAFASPAETHLLHPWASLNTLERETSDDEQQQVVVARFRQSMHPLVATLFPQSYLDRLLAINGHRLNMSMLHLETILHLVMNNMVDSQGIFTPAMVYEYCKVHFLPLLDYAQGSRQILDSIASNPGIKAIAKTMFRSAIEEGDEKVVSKLLSVTELGLDVDCKMEDPAATHYERRQLAPVAMSIRLGHVAVVTTLIKKFNARVNDSAVSTKDEKRCKGSFVLPIITEAHAPAFDRCVILRIILNAGAVICINDLMELSIREQTDLLRVLIDLIPKSRPCCWPWMTKGHLHQIASQLDFPYLLKLVEKLDLTSSELELTCIRLWYRMEPWHGVYVIADEPPNLIDIFSQRGDLQAIHTLRERGVRYTDNTMVAALRSRNPRLIEFALHDGATLDVFSPHYRTTPLAESIRLRQPNLTRQISQFLPTGTIYKDQQSYCVLLAAAAESGNGGLATQLLTRTMTRCSSTLGYACLRAFEADQTDIALALLQAGASTEPSTCIDILGPPPRIEDRCGLWCPKHTSVSTVPDMPSFIFAALRNRNAALFHALLDNGGVTVFDGADWRNKTSNIHGHDEHCMKLAAEWGDYTIMQCLISAGFNLVECLIAALRTANFALIEKLIVAVMESHLETSRNILEEATKANNADVVRLLLETPEFAPSTSELANAITWALGNDRTIIALLLDYTRLHANVRACWQALHKIPFDFLIHHNFHPLQNSECRDEVVRTIISINCSDLNSRLNAVRTFFESWSRSCSRESLSEWESHAIQLLLREGATPDCTFYRVEHYPIRSATVLTPLLVAIKSKDMALVGLLIESGADLNRPATKGIKRTPLQMAVEIGSRPIIDLLLSKGAALHAPCATRGGATPLQLAAFSGNIGLIERFLQLGVDPREPGAKVDGRTALEGAAEHGRLSVVKYLTEICSYSANECERAIKLAKGRGHGAVVDLLESISANLTPCEADEEDNMGLDQLLATLSLNSGSDCENGELGLYHRDISGLEDRVHSLHQRIEEIGDAEAYRDEGEISLSHSLTANDPQTWTADQSFLQSVESSNMIVPDRVEDYAQSLTPRHGSTNVQKSATMEEPTKRFACPQCGDRFPRKDTLRRHVDKHNKKRFSCAQCAQNFSRRDVLNRHLRRDHYATTR